MRNGRAISVLTICAAVTLTAPATAGAQIPLGAPLLSGIPMKGPPRVDLLAGANIQVDGAAANDKTGEGFSSNPGDGALASEVDFNADGRRDLVVGAHLADPLGRVDAGTVWIEFGNLPAITDLAALGAGGVRIDGAAAGDEAGVSVSEAGDVNCDGIQDIILGAPRAASLGRSSNGAAYVIFGSTSPPASIDLNALGNQGFRIDGAATVDFMGAKVAAAGNANGDECDDVIVGAQYNDPLGRIDAGAAYVVFGKLGNANVDLAALGAGGYPIYGAVGGPSPALGGDNAGEAVAGAGDVNGDGLGDQIVGAPSADPGGVSSAGNAYVVFGKANTTPIDLVGLGASGYTIEGEDGYTGFAVDNAGDVNFDGRPDQIVGAILADSGFEGEAYIVFGRTGGNVRVADLATNGTGYEISGSVPYEYVGRDVAGLGDVSGDGRPDQLVGAPSADYNGRSGSGAAFVVNGQAGTAPIELQSYVTGYRIEGPGVDAEAGNSVGGPGDVDGALGRDVAVTAPGNDANGRAESGSAYVISGTSRFRVAGIGNLSILGGSAKVPTTRRPEPQLQERPRTRGPLVRSSARGRTLRYTISAPMRVTMRVFRAVRGTRVPSGKLEGAQGPSLSPPSVRCTTRRAQPRRSQRRRPGGRARACFRYVRVAQVTRRHRRAGRVRVPFSAQVGRRVLNPDRYVLELRGRERNGKQHGPMRAAFQVVR